jgi:alkylation response protein AidB-like acyl-CoA dehydrogenase
VTDLWGSGPNPARVAAELADRTVNGRPALQDTEVQQILAQSICENRALTEINRRAYLAMAAGQEPGPEGSITKLVTINTRQQLSRVVMDLVGPSALALDDEAEARVNFTTSWLSAPTGRIAGGTDQILRNTIAEKILGLPQDYRPDKGVPFNEIPG